jgi:hypothetical protein
MMRLPTNSDSAPLQVMANNALKLTRFAMALAAADLAA